ncbi:MAG: LysM peptidoglycan-binding domain-containing M23 family metallopeptidase [Anaerolineaceae bacterium]|nr:MAG: LysM peptidoglycan-binding domain-containing M23 family metallopeptidase [Anaerolineaceae bacterium]
MTDHATILRMLRWFVFVTLPLIFYTAAPRYTFAEKNPLLIPVRPGDTWTALSIRYQLSVSELMAAAGAINPQRQPSIGSTLLLPLTNEKHGRLLRPLGGGLLETAMQNGRSPWTVALQNDLASPYTPLFYTPVFLAGGSTPPREFPFDLESLAVSQVPAKPGQALALRAYTGSEGVPHISLDHEMWIVTRKEDRLLALGATGAFFGAGQPELNIQSGEHPLWTQPWVFEDNEWKFEKVSFAKTAATDQEVIRLEREHLRTIWSQVTPDLLWSTPFQQPLQDYVALTSPYGARRSVNDGPYATYHEGTDFSAFRGSPVYAPGGGNVVLAESLTVRGGAVILDHGLGIHTGFYHLSEIDVSLGQKVEAGDLLGKVGSTGRSTGNHLHWDLLIGSTWVDAEAWMGQNSADWIRYAWGVPYSDANRSDFPSKKSP